MNGNEYAKGLRQVADKKNITPARQAYLRLVADVMQRLQNELTEFQRKESAANGSR